MTKMESDQLVGHYTKRAASYEQTYERPERQADLATLRERVSEALSGQRVLELACGTGYWTAHYAQVAASVLATDISFECLGLAQAKKLPPNKVQFELADAFDLQVHGTFSACFAAGWWSHVLRQDQEKYLLRLREKLGKETALVLLDSVYVEGISTSIARTDLEGNTFQIRKLPSGERHEVLKNFPTDSGLRKKLAGAIKDIRILRLEHYWMMTGRFK